MHKCVNGMTIGVQPKTKVASFKLTPDQYAAIEKRAKKCGVPVSAWMRAILTQAANRQADAGYLRIREPNGAIT